MELDWRDRKEVNGYRILHGNDTDIDLENDIYVEEINGSNIIDNSLKISIKLNKRLTNVDGYDIGNWTMVFKQGYKLGQLLDRVPFGVIDKTITGLGATTLEINSEVRNSIIVVPTKALAYNKCKSSNASKGENYCMYIGSEIGDIKKFITILDVKKYLIDREDKPKKFVAVADSLPMLIDFLTELSEDVYQDYFLMVDEIDTMQADSAYRPRLENVMDYYFKFKFYNRACISATMRDFSDESLKKEAFLRIEWEVQPKRDIKTIYTTYVDDLAWNEINLLLESDTPEKILVAYNSIDGINNIVKHLQISESECGILCSERSYDKAKTFIDDPQQSIDKDGHLKKRVTFMTCAYFAGIDIMDKCHLIAISSHLQPFTYLSLSRLAQIAGRCRPGTLSEIIIYDTPVKKTYSEFNNNLDVQNNMIARAINYSNVLNSVTDTINGEPNLKPLKEFIYSYMDFISKKKPTADSYPLTIVRENIDGKFVPAFFNIDALVETWELSNTLYTDKYTLINGLRKQGNIVTEMPDALLSREEHDSTEIQAGKARNKIRIQNSFLALKESLLDWVNIHNCNPDNLKEIRRNADKALQETVVDSFAFLVDYYDANEILAKLEECYSHETSFRNFYNAAIFYALPFNHPFKASLMASFKVDVNTGESKEYIDNKDKLKYIRNTYRSVCNNEIKSDDRVVSDLSSSFFEWKRGSKGVRVCGINPKGLKGLRANLSISASILSLLRLPKK